METRNICARAIGEHCAPGSSCPNWPKCVGHVRPVVRENQVYTQLVHFQRLLDTSEAVAADAERRARLAPVRQALLPAERAMGTICSKSAYRWIDMSSVFV